MPNPNAIVDKIARVEPPLDKPPADVLRESEHGLTFEFSDGRRARLDRSDERAPARAGILEKLRRRGKPVYVEVDPQSGVITRIQIPRVTHVEAVYANDAGDLVIAIPLWQGSHVLRRQSSDFDAWAALIREALERRMPVILTANETQDVIDLRWYPKPEDLPPFPRPGLPPEWWWRRWPYVYLVDIYWFILKLFGWWLSAVTQARANELFDLMASKSCDPLTVPPPCITFLYPENGCFARAHEMCRLMSLEGVTARKVFNYADYDYGLLVSTKNSPKCQVSWSYHVAPTLRVRQNFPTVQEQVIDPALFGAPVSTAAWQAKQTDPAAILVGTDASVYVRTKGGGTVYYDPNYVDTNASLDDFRELLQARATGPYGPPPYANCP
jgi:hypothetical protein